MLGSRPNVWAILSRDQARKGALTITCFSSPWPAYRSRQLPLSIRSKQESKKKKNKNKQKQQKNNNLWISLHGTSTRLLTGTTQIDLIDVPLLSLLNSPGTKSTLPPSVRPGWQARESWLRRAQAIFFWSGSALDDKHEAGEGYAIKTSFVGKLACPTKGVNDCFITMRLPLHHGKKFATIISTNAPTMTYTDLT